MARRTGAPVRQRRVAAELRILRKKAGLTCQQVCDALGFSASKISRMETGDRGMYAEDVAAMLGLYKVATPRRNELLRLIRDGAVRNWHQAPPKGLPESWEDVISWEREAHELTNFETLVIPGLLQTPEYARASLLGLDEALPEKTLEMLVHTRLSRQAMLSRRNAPELNVILYEVALRCPIGEPGVMHRQLQHLVLCAGRQNITIRVLPFATGAQPGLRGPFLIMDFPTQPSLVYLEHRGNTSFLEEDVHIRRARMDWQRLTTLALSQDESLRLITSIADELP